MKKSFEISGVAIESEIIKNEGTEKTSFMVKSRSTKYTYEMTNICDTEAEAEKTMQAQSTHIAAMFANIGKHLNVDSSSNFELKEE